MRDRDEGSSNVRQRVVAGIAVAVLLAGAGVTAALVLRPEPRTISPITSSTPAPTVPPGPCGDLSRIGDNPGAFVEEFMQRRIAGSTAESCMSDQAVDLYAAHGADPYDPNANGGAGPLCLYRCGSFRVVDYSVETEAHDSAEAVESDMYGTYEEAVIVLLSDGNETVRQYEAFSFGPGRVSTTDEQQVFVIRSAQTTRERPSS